MNQKILNARGYNSTYFDQDNSQFHLIILPVLLFDSSNCLTKCANIVPNDICSPPTPNKERNAMARMNQDRFESTDLGLSSFAVSPMVEKNIKQQQYDLETLNTYACLHCGVFFLVWPRWFFWIFVLVGAAKKKTCSTRFSRAKAKAAFRVLNCFRIRPGLTRESRTKAVNQDGRVTHHVIEVIGFLQNLCFCRFLFAAMRLSL